nr:MAG TPA: hypothetical protein [Caudoviricetes sp.]
MNSKCQDVILIYSLCGCPFKGSFIYSLHCCHLSAQISRYYAFLFKLNC